MNKNSKKIGIYSLIILAISLAAVVLRTIALMESYDIESGYFTSPLLMTISGAVIVGGVVLGLALAISLGKMSLKPTFDSPETYLPAGILGVATVVMLIWLLTSANIPALLGGEGTPENYISLISMLLSLPMLGHLYLTTLITDRIATVRAYFSIGAIAFLALLATFIYFDTSYAMNSHTKIVDEMAMLSLAVFFVYEARISLGREKWRGYIATGMIASAVSLYSAIPNLVVYIARDGIVSMSLEMTMFILAGGVFALSRLVLTAKLQDASEPPEIVAMRAYAQERERLVIYGPMTEDEVNAQFTIDDILTEAEEEPSEEAADASEIIGEEDAEK